MMWGVGGVDGRGRGGGWNRLSTPEAGAALRGAHTRCCASSAFDMQRRVSVQQIQQKGLRRKRPSGSRAGASKQRPVVSPPVRYFCCDCQSSGQRFSSSYSTAS